MEIVCYRFAVDWGQIGTCVTICFREIQQFVGKKQYIYINFLHLESCKNLQIY